MDPCLCSLVLIPALVLSILFGKAIVAGVAAIMLVTGGGSLLMTRIKPAVLMSRRWFARTLNSVSFRIISGSFATVGAAMLLFVVVSR